MLRASLVTSILLAACALSCGPAGSPPAASVAPAAPSPGPAAGAPVEMRSYFIAFLRRGPAWSPDKTPEVKRIGEAHMAHIEEMANSGKLLVAGPFEIEGTPENALAGLFLFDVPTIEEARALAGSDPAVKAGRFTVEVLKWFGPKGLTYTGHKR